MGELKKLLYARCAALSYLISQRDVSFNSQLMRKPLLDHWAFLEKRFEPLNTNFSHFRVYRIAKAYTFPLESNLNIDKNRSTSCIGGFWETDAPSLICSEPPSLKSGENIAQQGYFLKNLMEIIGMVKKLKGFQNKTRIEIPQVPNENPVSRG